MGVETASDSFESASYVSLTVGALSDFGVDIKREDNVFYVHGGQRPYSSEYNVEGDCSNAAFLEAFNLLGGSVEVEGISPVTAQGDRVYKEIFEGLRLGEKEFDLSDCPDLAPVSFALAAALGGAVFTGTARLRIKESDRAAAMAQELENFGASVCVSENSVAVSSEGLKPPCEQLCGHNDHRIVMALSLLAAATGGIIDGAQAVKKSYPDFFDTLRTLKVVIEEYEA